MTNKTASEITFDDCPSRIGDENAYVINRKMRDFLLDRPKSDFALFDPVFRLHGGRMASPIITKIDDSDAMCIRVLDEQWIDGCANCGEIRWHPEASRLVDNIIARAEGETIPHPELERPAAPQPSPAEVPEADLPTKDVLDWLDATRAFFVEKGRADFHASKAMALHAALPPRPASLDATGSAP